MMMEYCVMCNMLVKKRCTLLVYGNVESRLQGEPNTAIIQNVETGAIGICDVECVIGIERGILGLKNGELCRWRM